MTGVDPEGHTAAEDLDEDQLRVDPLEEGMDPPEHWSQAMEHGTTERETREGQDLDERLSEEEPDPAPPREPRDEVDRMDERGELEGHPADGNGYLDVAHERPSDHDRATESADEAAASVARELRTPRD